MKFSEIGAKLDSRLKSIRTGHKEWGNSVVNAGLATLVTISSKITEKAANISMGAMMKLEKRTAQMPMDKDDTTIQPEDAIRLGDLLKFPVS